MSVGRIEDGRTRGGYIAAPLEAVLVLVCWVMVRLGYNSALKTC